MNDVNNENLGNEVPQHAVSLYGQGEGIDDFPVLKAFQQYIDAEQEKARKRLLGLGLFFGGVLIVVIIVFMFLLHGINMRNQSLSDRLIEFAMREANDRHEKLAQGILPMPATTANDETLKAMTETLVSLQKEISEASESKSKRFEIVEPDSVTRARAQLEAERKTLALERERLRQLEIEQQRRKLYPECYAEDGTLLRAPRTSSHVRTSELTDDDIRDILREAYQDLPNRHINASKTSDSNNNAIETDDDDDPIQYFKDDDYTIPVDIKGTSKKVKFTVPVE